MMNLNPPPNQHTCSGLEEHIAALLENQLPDDERRDLIEHLNDCSGCYELFIDLASFEDGEENFTLETGLPPLDQGEPKWNRNKVWAVAASVALVVMAVSAITTFRFNSTSAATLTASFSTNEEMVSRLDDNWSSPQWPTLRSVDSFSAIRAGVRVVDLHLALRMGESDLASEIASELGAMLNPASPDLSAKFLQISDRLEAGQKAADQLSLARGGDQRLATQLKDQDLRDYRLGRLAEAARLSARVGDSSFFTSRRNRRLMKVLGESGPASSTELEAALRLSAKQPLTESSMKELELLFTRVLQSTETRDF